VKIAWQHIRWELIFKLLHINLNLIYDCPILSHWPVESVKKIHELLIIICDYPKEIIDNNYDMQKVKDLRDDIYELRYLFSIYVEKKMYY
jgi:hypothetical protein